MLEAILVLPVLLMVGFGGVEYGYFIYVKSVLQSAARDGARQSTLTDATNTTVTDAVARSMTSAGLANCGYTVALNPTNMSGLPSGTQIKVTVSCPWSTTGVHLLPAALGGIPSNRTVSFQAVFNRE
jgi:Flp pilus assembly protein TadG